MDTEKIVFNYQVNLPLTGLSGSSWTKIPGTEIKLPEGRYLMSGVIRIGIARSAFDGNTNTMQFVLIKDGDTVLSTHAVNMNITGSQTVVCTMPFQLIENVLSSGSTFCLSVYISDNGTVTTRDITFATFKIEKIN